LIQTCGELVEDSKLKLLKRKSLCEIWGRLHAQSN